MVDTEHLSLYSSTAPGTLVCLQMNCSETSFCEEKRDEKELNTEKDGINGQKLMFLSEGAVVEIPIT